MVLHVVAIDLILNCLNFFYLGFLDIHRELDNLVAEFLGVEAAITIPMGFATNSMNMPSLVGKVSFIINDVCSEDKLVKHLKYL